MDNQNSVGDQTQKSSAHDETSANAGKVGYETYKKVLDEVKKVKDLNRSLLEEKSKQDESKLKEQNEWKTLADQYKEKLDNTTKTLQEQEKSIVNGMKFQEFEKLLGGKLKNSDYAKFVEFERIVLHPETKKVDEDSVKAVVADFVKNHSALIEFSGTQRLPNKTGNSTNIGKPDFSKMTSAELQDELKKLGKI